MAENLDLATGKEPRISVNVSGWEAAKKSHFAKLVQELDSVERVQSAGGSTCFYIYYHPAKISEDGLTEHLKTLANSIGAFVEAHSSNPADYSSPSLEPDIPVTASDWTGIKSVQERIVAFKQLAPVALAAVDSLMTRMQSSGDNGGPPLDEREEAIDALRGLHATLGKLLVAVEKPSFAWVDGEGLIASCAHYAKRAHQALCHDPMPFAASGLVLAIFATLGFPGLGGWLSGAALAIRRSSK